MACHGIKLGRKVVSLSRLFSSTSSYASREREARMLAKMLADRKDKKFWNAGPRTTVSSALDMASKRRAAVLNKLFLVQISEAMMYGKSAEKIAGRGIEITKVEMCNFSKVNVFWICKESEPFLEVEEDLKSISGLIREDLMYSKVMGQVPLINFIRDLKKIAIMQTDELLLKVALSIPKEEENLKEFESADPPEEEEQVSPNNGFEAMMMNTLGLRYDSIFSRIKDSKSRKLPVIMPDPQLSTGDNFTFHSKKPVFDRKQEIKNFIRVFNKERSQAQKRKQKNQFEHLSQVEIEEEEEEDEDEDEDEDVDYSNGYGYDFAEENQFGDYVHKEVQSVLQGRGNIDEEIDTFGNPRT